MSCYIIIWNIPKWLIPPGIQHKPNNTSLFHLKKIVWKSKLVFVIDEDDLEQLSERAFIPANSYLIIRFIDIDSNCMGKNTIMGCNVRLASGISRSTISKWLRTMTGRVASSGIAKLQYEVWFIDCYPIFYSITKFFETNFSKVSKILPVNQIFLKKKDQ